MIEFFNEIWSVIGRNKLRNFLTGFSIAWGIFILIVLLGAGNGIENGINEMFSFMAKNSMKIYPGNRSIPYKGQLIGKRIELDNGDYSMLKKKSETDRISAIFNIGSSKISYRDIERNFSVHACHSDYSFINNHTLIKGRFLNEMDASNKRKITIIGKDVAQIFFKEKNCIGEEIMIDKIVYKVAGVYDKKSFFSDSKELMIPISTAQLVYGGFNKINRLSLTMNDITVSQSLIFEKEVAASIGERHSIHPDDKEAIYLRNNLEQSEKINGIFSGIKTFLWIIGLSTLIAGIVGVSNIMLVSVKERTKEIGIRKALGAGPRSVVSLIIAEAIIITSFSGYIGLVMGVATLEMANRFLPSLEYLRNPEVDMSVAVSATVLLVIAGGVAGAFPAVRAASVRPVIALKEE